MTLAIVATAGSADANAFCTLAEVEAYVATLCFSDAWTAKTDENKKAAIISAARWMNGFRWVGMRSSQAQAMAWPRCGSYEVRFIDMHVAGNGYLLDQDGYQVPVDTVPQCIKDANAEYALRLLAEDRAADAGALVPENVQIGSLNITNLHRNSIPASVLELVRYFLSPSGCVQVVRG